MVKPYYEDNFVTLYHGDNLEIVPQLGTFDLVLTDPPYNHKHMDGGGFAAATKFYAGGALDGMNEFDLSVYGKILLEASPMLIAFCSRDGIVGFANMAAGASRKFDLHFWYKTNAIPFCKNTWKSDVEYIALVWAQKPGWVQHHQSMHSKVYVSSLCRDPLHPAAKPIPLLQKYIAVLDAKTILDPFAGSGTVGAAAKALGRRAVLVEREEAHCEKAAYRCQQEYLAL